MKVLSVLVERGARALDRPFTYCYLGARELKPYVRLHVLFGRKRLVGFLSRIEETEESLEEVSARLGFPVRTVEETRRQIFTGTGERIALAYRAASRLTRIAPPFLLMKIIRRLGPSVSGSFMFSFISGSSLSEARFAGRKLSNLYHLPSMPPIAGLGVFFNMFDNRLNAVVSYRSGVFPEADVDRFARKLEKELRGNGGE